MASAKIFGYAINVEAEEEDGGASSISGEISRSGIQPDGEAMCLSVRFSPFNQRESVPYFRFLESNSNSGSDCMDSESDPRNCFIDFFDRESFEVETAREFYISPNQRISTLGEFDIWGSHETREDIELGLRIGSGPESGSGQLRGDSGGVGLGVTANMETDSGRVEVGTGLTPAVNNLFVEQAMVGHEELELVDLQNAISWVEEEEGYYMQSWQDSLPENSFVNFEESEDIMVVDDGLMGLDDYGIFLDSVFEHEIHVDYSEVFSQMVDNDEPGGVMGRPPALKSAVDELPVVEITSEELSKGNMVCAICRDEFVVEEKIKRLPCRHYYHGECIVPWLGIRNTCPVCRYELPTDDLEYEWNKRISE